MHEESHVHSDELKLKEAEEQIHLRVKEPEVESSNANAPASMVSSSYSSNSVESLSSGAGAPRAASKDEEPFKPENYELSPILVASLQTIFVSGGVLLAFTFLLQLISPSLQNSMDNYSLDRLMYKSDLYQPKLFGVDLSHLGNLDQVLGFLPIAFFGVCLLTGLVVYIARESRSRDIDWTDTHLMLEISGPLTLAIRWSAIESVQQLSVFDIFNGNQPAFLVKTREGNQFKLRLSDISRKHNIGTFFSLIKTSAPKAALHVDPNFASDNSYTELWLKYFSVPAERQKTGMLENKMVLDNGRYEICGTVGGGGQGTAYLAAVRGAKCSSERHSEHIADVNPEKLRVNDRVVLKEYVLPIHRGQLTAERTAEKLRAEAEILQKLNHPQIVELKDAFVEDFRGYLVLEYVTGDSLKSLVENTGPQSEKAVIEWMLLTCDILEYMHGQSPPVVHRDITPDNLMLQDDGLIKLVDFNVAYQVDSSATSTVVGKHAYIPAEQFRGKATPQSDIYSLGGTMFFLLTGKDPAPITPSHPQRFNNVVSDEMDSIVAKSTAGSLSARFADVQELRLALKQLLDKLS